MRDWGFSPSPDELSVVAEAAKLYRDRWESIRAPFPAAFDGSVDDVRALDYMAYEGIDIPGGGIDTASMVCGEALRRAAGLEWVISHRGDWFIASAEDATHDLAICPLARLHEIECGGRRGAMRHMWFAQKAAFDCLLYLEGAEERAVREFLERGGDYLEFAEKTLERLRPPASSSRSRGRRR